MSSVVLAISGEVVEPVLHIIFVLDSTYYYYSALNADAEINGLKSRKALTSLAKLCLQY